MCLMVTGPRARRFWLVVRREGVSDARGCSQQSFLAAFEATLQAQMPVCSVELFSSLCDAARKSGRAGQTSGHTQPLSALSERLGDFSGI